MNELLKKMLEELSTIQQELNAAHEDTVKFSSGNNTAGTRIRKSMQSVKSAAQRIRTTVQEEKNAMA
jgi:high-affinity K+ transport system ATPase subunit B